jgi:hypothetical protein
MPHAWKAEETRHQPRRCAKKKQVKVTLEGMVWVNKAYHTAYECVCNSYGIVGLIVDDGGWEGEAGLLCLASLSFLMLLCFTLLLLAVAWGVLNQLQRVWGGALIQQWHLWLVDPPPAVCVMIWRVVVLPAIWAKEQAGKRLWPLVHTPARHGSAEQQAVSKASTSFWSALYDFARHDRPVLARGWDKVGPCQPLCARIQVPLRPCQAVVLPQ